MNKILIVYSAGAGATEKVVRPVYDCSAKALALSKHKVPDKVLTYK